MDEIKHDLAQMRRHVADAVNTQATQEFTALLRGSFNALWDEVTAIPERLVAELTSYGWVEILSFAVSVILLLVVLITAMVRL